MGAIFLCIFLKSFKISIDNITYTLYNKDTLKEEIKTS
nr:MAG TPA: hypothetical protein [Caudoviricetes sp.]